jgi:hypothetical protein
MARARISDNEFESSHPSQGVGPPRAEYGCVLPSAFPLDSDEQLFSRKLDYLVTTIHPCFADRSTRSLVSQRTRAAAPYRASQTDKSPCACWKKSRRWLTFTWSGSRVVVKRNSCRQSPWYPSSSPFYCWGSRRHTPRRGVPSTVAGEVERIVASIPFNNAWLRSREMVGSAPRTNSRIPIGVVGRGPVRGELRFGVIALNRRKGCRPPPTTGPLDSGPLTAARRRNAALLQSCWNGPQ